VEKSDPSKAAEKYRRHDTPEKRRRLVAILDRSENSAGRAYDSHVAGTCSPSMSLVSMGYRYSSRHSYTNIRAHPWFKMIQTAPQSFFNCGISLKPEFIPNPFAPHLKKSLFLNPKNEIGRTHH
jgi:hypothetical protein